MDIFSQVDLLDCPLCGGPALLEEENGWSVYVMCLDCGCHTAGVNYNSEAERLSAAEKAAFFWNTGKVLSDTPGE